MLFRIRAENGEEQIVRSTGAEIKPSKSASPKKRRIEDNQQTEQEERYCPSSSVDPEQERRCSSLSVDYSSPNLSSLSTPYPDPEQKPSSGDVFNLAESFDHITNPEVQRFAILRASEIKKGRPTDSRLLCCDYNAADSAMARGEIGPPELGGWHLCRVCEGIYEGHEYQDDAFGKGLISYTARTGYEQNHIV